MIIGSIVTLSNIIKTLLVIYAILIGVRLIKKIINEARN